MSGDSRPSVGQPSDARPGRPESDLPGAAKRDWGQITLEKVVRPVAIAGMLTCMAISLAQVVALITPLWPGRFFTILIFLVSLESIHAQRIISRQGLATRDRARFRFVEWVVILLVARLGISLSRGTGGLMVDIAAWSTDLISFFEPIFIVGSSLLAGAWTASLQLSQAFQDLEATPLEREPSITDPDFYLRSTMPQRGRTDRQARLGLIVSVFFWGGVIILMLSGLARVDVRDLVTLRHPRSSGIILNVLAYFLIGFLLISQAQYTILKANWDLENVPVLGKLGKRWILLVASFLLLVALASALLPVSYSVGLLEAVSSAVMWLVFALMKAVALVLLILQMIVGFLTGRPQSTLAPSTRRPPPTIAPPPPGVADEPWPWWGLVRSLIFWMILTGVVGYSALHFVRDRWGLFQGVSLARFLTWLRGIWESLRLGTRRTAARIRQGIARRLASRRPRERSRARRYLSLRRLSPRDRVRYYYLAILHRSRQQGFGRPPGTTPLEYQETLADKLPEATDQVAQLSWAFVEARYSQHPISVQEARGVRDVWRIVKKALTARRRASGKEAAQATTQHHKGMDT